MFLSRLSQNPFLVPFCVLSPAVGAFLVILAAVDPFRPLGIPRLARELLETVEAGSAIGDLLCRVLLLLNPLGDFKTMNWHVLWGSDADSYLTVLNAEDGDLDIFADGDYFAGSAHEN